MTPAPKTQPVPGDLYELNRTLGQLQGTLDGMTAVLDEHTKTSRAWWDEQRERWRVLSQWQGELSSFMVETKDRLANGSENFTDVFARLSRLEQQPCIDLDAVEVVVARELEKFSKDLLKIHNLTTPAAKPQPDPENGNHVTFRWMVEKTLLPVIMFIVGAVVTYLITNGLK